MAVLQHELTSLGEAADLLSRALPGHRVEMLQGRLTVTPPPDGSHALSLTKLGRAFDRAGIVEAGFELDARAERLAAYPLAAEAGREMFQDHERGFEVGLDAVLVGISVTLRGSGGN